MFNYEGTLHITLLEPESPTKPSTYAITFTPYAHGGGALKRVICYGKEKVTELLSLLGIPQDTIARALEEVSKPGSSASIPKVVLNEAQLNKYGLGEVSFTQSIRDYLGAMTSST
mgnify:CR=1 FL=1